MENWNSANTDPFYGSAGTLPGSDKEHQEVSMLSLHLHRQTRPFAPVLVQRQPLRPNRHRHEPPPRPRLGRLRSAGIRLWPLHTSARLWWVLEEFGVRLPFPW
ncbi:hypothetical protein ACFYUV_51140 [Nonomuraea sp. NPDC003560]|uniref:hypothetical protein n=1 Tax=Nonomuraea sp. NPDC003560 TaxID=3364341 RepID=UPI0036B3A15E